MTPAEISRVIDAGYCHSRAVRSLSKRQRAAAAAAAAAGWLRLMPRGRYARRYVLTASGSHWLGTFESDRSLYAEIAEIRRAAARERYRDVG